MDDKKIEHDFWTVKSLFSALTQGDPSEASPIAALHAANQALWACEDAVRSRALPDAAVVALKRRIDALNLERHAWVATIDRAADARFPAHLPADDPRARVGSESIGQMLDRVSVVTLKRAAMQAVGDVARAQTMDDRLALLARCVDERLDALRRGVATRQAFDEGKTYSA